MTTQTTAQAGTPATPSTHVAWAEGSLVPVLGVYDSTYDTVYAFVTTCSECGSWTHVGTYADDVCDYCE